MQRNRYSTPQPAAGAPAELTPRLLSAVVLSCLVAGCGGATQFPNPVAQTSLGGAPQVAARQSVPLHRHSMTFSYTGAQQTFTVPEGVTRVTVKASGAGYAAPSEMSPAVAV